MVANAERDFDAALTRLQRSLDAQQLQIDTLQKRQAELREEISELQARGPLLRREGALTPAVPSTVPYTADVLQNKLSPSRVHAAPPEEVEEEDDGDDEEEEEDFAAEAQVQDPCSFPSSSAHEPRSKKRRRKKSPALRRQDQGAVGHSASGTTSTVPASALQELLGCWVTASGVLRMLGLQSSLQLKATSLAVKDAIAVLDFAFPLWFPVKIYAIGGSASCNQGAPLSTVECFSPEAGKWDMLPCLHIPRKYAAAACGAGCLYVIGGHNGHRPLVEVERYNFASGIWEVMPSMREPRYAATAACLHGHIYTIGGHSGRETLQSSERLDMTTPFERRWEPLPNLQLPRMLASAMVLDKSLFVVGGMRSWDVAHDTAEQLMLEQWAWKARPLPRQLKPRLSACTAKAGCLIVTAGGHATKDRRMQPSAVVEGLCGSANMGIAAAFATATGGGVALSDTTEHLHWRELPPLQVSRVGAAAVAVDTQVFVLGGSAAGESLKSVEMWRLEDEKWCPLPALSIPRVALAAAASRC